MNLQLMIQVLHNHHDACKILGSKETNKQTNNYEFMSLFNVLLNNEIKQSCHNYPNVGKPYLQNIVPCKHCSIPFLCLQMHLLQKPYLHLLHTVNEYT